MLVKDIEAWLDERIVLLEIEELVEMTRFSTSTNPKVKHQALTKGTYLLSKISALKEVAIEIQAFKGRYNKFKLP